MHFWKDYLSRIFWTFWHALALTDTLVIGAFIVAGILAAFGFYGGHVEHPAWWIALAIFLVSLLVLLVRMPYRLYADQRTTINALNTQMARISEDRPFRFNDITIERWLRRNPAAYGPWTIQRMILHFENVGDQPLNWRIPKLSLEHEKRLIPIILPDDRKYCLLARDTMDLGFDVPDLDIVVHPLGNPTTVRVKFCVEYDNIVALRVRKMKRVIDCNIRNLVGDDYYSNVVEQREW
jgi:hypothetical protein